MSIPRVSESDDQRKLRLEKKRVEELESQLQDLRSSPPAPLADGAVQTPDDDAPDAVKMAFDFATSVMQTTQPLTMFNPFSGGSSDQMKRDQNAAEITAHDSACMLLADFFDRHNHRLVANQRKQPKSRQKPKE